MPFFHCIAANAMATMSSWDPQVTQLWLILGVRQNLRSLDILVVLMWYTFFTEKLTSKTNIFQTHNHLNAISEFICCSSKAIANLSWAYATISFLHDPLMVAVSQRAVMVITEFTPQNLSNSNVDQDFGIEEGSGRHVDARSKFMCKSSPFKTHVFNVFVMIWPTGQGGETVVEELEQAP